MESVDDRVTPQDNLVPPPTPIPPPPDADMPEIDFPDEEDPMSPDAEPQESAIQPTSLTIPWTDAFVETEYQTTTIPPATIVKKRIQ